MVVKRNWRVVGLPAAIAGLLILASLPAESLAVKARAADEPGAGVLIPGKQGSGGSTLELPSVPARQGSPRELPPQQAQPERELVIPSLELRNQLGYAQVTVTVEDPGGSYVTGLQKDDFKVYVDGRPRPVEFFRNDLHTPVSVGILVDTSGSMRSKIVQARAAIAEFLRDLNDQDDIFLVAFSGEPYLLQPLTTDHLLVRRRLSLLHASGKTALFDAILQGLRMVQRGRYDKKALLVVTDGVDLVSRATVNDVVLQARRMGVLVYSIGIGNPNPPPTLVLGPFLFPGGLERVDAQTLKTLSTETGARTYLIRQVGDGEALRRACQTISLELREQYTIGFLAPDPGAGGYRDLRVDVPGRPEVGVRVRKGIEIGRHDSASAMAPTR